MTAAADNAVWRRFRRIRTMPRRELAAAIADRARDILSPARAARRLAFWLDRATIPAFDRTYREREDAGPRNLRVKLERQAGGGPFEPTEISLINRAAPLNEYEEPLLAACAQPIASPRHS